jgi:hypothetical protein
MTVDSESMYQHIFFLTQVEYYTLSFNVEQDCVAILFIILLSILSLVIEFYLLILAHQLLVIHYLFFNQMSYSSLHVFQIIFFSSLVLGLWNVCADCKLTIWWNEDFFFVSLSKLELGLFKKLHSRYEVINWIITIYQAH